MAGAHCQGDKWPSRSLHWEPLTPFAVQTTAFGDMCPGLQTLPAGASRGQRTCKGSATGPPQGREIGAGGRAVN